MHMLVLSQFVTVSFFIIISTTVPLARAFAPPHPTLFPEWESVHAMRRRLNVSYNYKTKYINAEYCRYSNETECYQYDMEYHSAVLQRRRRLQKQQQRQETTNLQRITQQNDVPNEGTVRVLVLLIRFKGHESHKLPSKDYFNELFNYEGPPTKMNPVGSIREYFRFASLGKFNGTYIKTCQVMETAFPSWRRKKPNMYTFLLNVHCCDTLLCLAHFITVTFDIEDWFQLDKTEEFFGQGKFGLLSPSELQNLAIPKLDSLDNAEFDWAKYDSSGFGTLDHLGIIHSGYAAEYGDPSSTCKENKAINRMWSQGATVSSDDQWQSKSYFGITNFFVSSAYSSGLCQTIPAFMGAYVHEFLHDFGLKDLYDQDLDEAKINLGGVGSYDVMSNYHGW